jgi:DNA-binding CsgD family transcriptional regulator
VRDDAVTPVPPAAPVASANSGAALDPELSRFIEGVVGDSLSALGYEVVVIVAGRRRPGGGVNLRPPIVSQTAAIPRLTPRESQVAAALVDGESNRQIAARLGVSEHTARRHTERILRKLGVRSRFAVAQRLGREPAARRPA